MNKVVCFGEILMRFTPSINGDWLKDNHISVFAGGAEANVASALARWGVPVNYVTAAPGNFLADQLLTFLNNQNIETSSVNRSGNRIGTYYLTSGADVKNAEVIYDRQYSSFWDLKPGMINWENVFADADWFHFSAICPALNQNVASVCLEALKVATAKHIKVSIDLNYREKLWKYGKQPSEVMPELVQYCDLVMGNIWAANKMLNIPLSQDFGTVDRDIYTKQAKETAENIIRDYPRCKIVANTFRFSNGDQLNYYAELYDNSKSFSSAEYHTDSVVDKVGSGDCFMAGLIYGYQNNQKPQDVIDYATAAAFQKLFVKGDATDKSVDEIKSSIKNV